MMPPLNEIKADVGPVHLLLVAGTKMGKSTYTADAAADGFEVAYFDADNGLSALRYRLGQLPPEESAAAMKRVNYFGTTRPELLLKGVLRSTSLRPYFWMPESEKIWGAKMNLPEDTEVWRFDISRIPKNMVLAIDSWTSLANDSLQMFRADQLAPLLDGVNQSIYGDAKAICDFLSNILQNLPCHVIVQAHATRYEIYEKPKNMKAGEAKQKDMTLLETWEVPVSSSKIAGFDMGKRFNHIGWLGLNNLGAPEIDFTRAQYRVGGGPPNRKAKTTELSFKKLVEDSKGAMPDSVPQPDSGWFIKLTHAEMVALEESKKKG